MELPGSCPHVQGTHPPVPAGHADGCEECLQTGGQWVELRECLTCGHVGCCDTSPGRHAAAHWATTAHPATASLEPGDLWGWCYADLRYLGSVRQGRAPRRRRTRIARASGSSRS
ncbi:UBP-type zinc finger domain-containing protein [Nonomuraea turcica]|uniref:UBP-type zinc finger domain-containing protein n=1 Tax=Nonomuraea sp. G32 TaxID=3067274 RepID=UPI00273CF35B|nr:UBP-type zinc finger domain-containing protein [Nonomuraea sp. G32]MDP4509295.1 UBP-type zinc finger domain-containing protein [Nonomuraea sp. G32]